MTTQSPFWPLVRHDMKRRKQRAWLQKEWRMAYGIAVLIVVISITTYASRRVNLDLNSTWYFTFWFPFMVFGLSTTRIVYEWKNGTADWWLSLPASRLRLVASKFVASLVQAVLIFAVVYCAVAILGLYAMFLKGSFTTQFASSFLIIGLKYNLLLICVSPFVAAFGVLVGVLRQTRAKPAVPLVWIVFGGIWWMWFSNDGHYLQKSATPGTGMMALSPSIYYLIVGSWLVAYLLVRLAAYLLDRQLTL